MAVPPGWSAAQPRARYGCRVRLRSRSQRIWIKCRRLIQNAFCPVKLARHSICRAQTSPGQNAGQVCGICKFSFARKSSDTAAVPGAELRSAPSGRNAGRRFYEKRCKSAASFIADSGAVRYNRNIPARHTGTFLLQIGYALQNGRGEAEYGSME